MTRPRVVLLKEWEVRPLLDGSKTMIARAFIGVPTKKEDGSWFGFVEGHGQGGPGSRDRIMRCPFGEPGDVLLCKEAFGVVRPTRDSEGTVDDEEWYRGKLPRERPAWHESSSPFDHWSVAYRADVMSDEGGWEFWRPPQHMPPWAVRIRPVTVSVTAKRCTEITEAEAIACGITTRCLAEPDEPPECSVGYRNPDAFAMDNFRNQWAKDNPRHPWESSWAWLATVRRDG